MLMSVWKPSLLRMDRYKKEYTTHASSMIVFPRPVLPCPFENGSILHVENPNKIISLGEKILAYKISNLPVRFATIDPHMEILVSWVSGIILLHCPDSGPPLSQRHQSLLAFFFTMPPIFFVARFMQV